jgi:hypothetical protein
MRFSKRLQAGNPAIFSFPITSKFPHNSPTIGRILKKKKGRQKQAAQKFRVVYRCCAQVPVPLLRQFCWSI